MTLRENALGIINFGSPERIVGGPPVYGLTYHGCNHEGYEGGGHDCPVGSRWTDIWGTGWHKEHADVMGFPRVNPLAEISALAGYEWPDPNDPRICGKIYEIGEGYQQGDVFLGGQHRDTLWEKAYMLVGMENMMVYLHTEPDYATEVLRRIMDFQLGISEHYLKLGIEMAFCGDDLGTQSAPLLSPQVIEEFFVPEYKRLFDLYKSRGVTIHFHSCGHVEELLDIYMDLGIDVLNPVQATANDLDFIRERTQGRMALQGGVSTKTICEGPIERIVEETRYRMWQLGRNGGYFCGPDQGMPFPPGHLEAHQRTVEEFGGYPVVGDGPRGCNSW